VKAALLIAAAALGAAAPLAAQEAAAPAAAPEPTAQPAAPTAPGPILLVSGPDALVARLGTAPLDPDGLLCLEAAEEAIFVSDRVTFQLSGPGCFTAAYGEHKAFEEEQRALAGEAVIQAAAAYDLALASGEIGAIERALAHYEATLRSGPDAPAIEDAPVVGSTGGEAEREARAEAERRRQSESERANVDDERRAAAAAARQRPRTGAARPAAAPRPAAASPRPLIFRLASASPTVLERFPRGTLVQRTTALCLKQGEEATIVSNHGQSVSYSGPGCLHRRAKPTGTNVGGFTFG
jgi:hypothetical protein